MKHSDAITPPFALNETVENAIRTDISQHEPAFGMSCIVAITDKRGILIFVDDKFVKNSNLEGVLISRHYQRYVFGLFSKEIINGRQSVVENGKTWLGKLKIKTKREADYWLRVTIISCLDDKGSPYQYIVSSADVSLHAPAFIPTNGQPALQTGPAGKRMEETIFANHDFIFEEGEKEKRAAELVIANTELAFQNKEKELRSSELIIANTELAFQNKEKEMRSSELIIANTELAFQNKEKEMRSSELIIANTELAFQNKEKEMRSYELIVANRELVFQNREKERRAAELLIANSELLFQNEEKEKRAAELTAANNELKHAEEDIRKLNEDVRKLNAELEQKVIERTAQLESMELVNRELESFSYSVSHDLRAPLRAVNGYAKILEEDYNLLFDDEGKRLLAIVQLNAKRMGALIDDLLAFSRLGREELSKSVVNMNELAAKIISELNTSANSKAEIQLENLYPAIADSRLMTQVWINILSNAIKYSSQADKPFIRISCEKTDKELIYSVADNGVGFDMQYAHKLFGVFQRLHASEDFEGTGVGLALVHRIITKHKGRVWANAVAGKGATFYFSIPYVIT